VGDALKVRPNWPDEALTPMSTESAGARAEGTDASAPAGNRSQAFLVKVVSDRLGHESGALTLTEYAHGIPGMQAEAAEQVARLVEGSATEIMGLPPWSLGTRCEPFARRGRAT
jgi:hypothetical protein